MRVLVAILVAAGILLSCLFVAVAGGIIWGTPPAGWMAAFSLFGAWFCGTMAYSFWD